MAERLEDNFNPELEVVTYNGEVVAVLYDGRPLSWSETDGDQSSAIVYRDVYENGDALDVLAVEVPQEES